MFFWEVILQVKQKHWLKNLVSLCHLFIQFIFFGNKRVKIACCNRRHWNYADKRNNRFWIHHCDITTSLATFPDGYDSHGKSGSTGHRRQADRGVHAEVVFEQVPRRWHGTLSRRQSLHLFGTTVRWRSGLRWWWWRDRLPASRYRLSRLTFAKDRTLKIGDLEEPPLTILTETT